MHFYKSLVLYLFLDLNEFHFSFVSQRIKR